jgi:hypothetical protein
MKKIMISSLLLIGMAEATEYQIAHLKKGGTLNVREVPVLDSKTVVGKIPSNGTGIRIKHCKYNKAGNEWCYINYPLGGYHLEGWVNRHFLKPMKENTTSKTHISNFLTNFYMADEENFLDKLQVFYSFPMQQYFKRKNISLMQLRSQKVDYYKSWPQRDYKLTHMKILKRRSKYIDVQTTVRWHKKGKDEQESGKDIQKLRLIPTDNSFKVSAIKNLKHTVFPKPKPVEELNETIATASTTEVKREGVEASTPVKTTTQPLSNKKYYIKAGSFFGAIKDGYLSNITQNGFAYMVQRARQNNSVIRRVYIGPFSSSAEATNALVKVRSKINKNAYIQTVK